MRLIKKLMILGLICLVVGLALMGLSLRTTEEVYRLAGFVLGCLCLMEAYCLSPFWWQGLMLLGLVALVEQISFWAAHRFCLKLSDSGAGN